MVSKRQPTLSQCVLLILVFVLLASCSPAQSTPTAAPATQPALPTATVAQPTEAPSAIPTSLPSPTLADTATALPTETPQPTAVPALALTQDGISGWCLPVDDYYTAKELTSTETPKDATPAEYKDNALEVNRLPASACAFLFTFNQPVPAGLKMQLFEVNQKAAWLNAAIQPIEGSPNTAGVILRHSYVIAPPAWNLKFEFALVDAGGKELIHSGFNVHRYTTKVCWNGQLPNVNTLRCQKPQDQHPWDPLYLTPMPTYAPGVDPERGW